MSSKNTNQEDQSARPPVVAVMGHIDHGKSTLLDFIRKSNSAEKEAGGITQHLGAYEAVHKSQDGIEHRITFLDTPGHEAFKGIRERGAKVADIVILVVSGEDGVKPQTLEALSYIKKNGIPFAVAVTKMDKETANLEKTKQSLAEKEIYVEGYGGDIPCVPVSSKTGEGVGDLLEMIVLMSEVHGTKSGNQPGFLAFVIESKVEKSGIGATLIIREGLLKKGWTAVAESAYAPLRRIEDSTGKIVESVGPGRPAKVIGWSKIPRVGSEVSVFESKRDAEKFADEWRLREQINKASPSAPSSLARLTVPVVIKADTSGSLEAVEHELRKYNTDRVELKVIQKGVGTIGENDIKSVTGNKGAIVVGFNVILDGPAKSYAERGGIEIGTFDIIYKLAEWVESLVKEKTPKTAVEETTGTAKIMKIFSTEKDKQVVGGKVLDGELHVGDEFVLSRREAPIGKGKIRELQKFKEKTSSVPKDSEFGAFVSSTIEVMPGDKITAFVIVLK